MNELAECSEDVLFKKKKRNPDSYLGESRGALLHVGSPTGRKGVLVFLQPMQDNDITNCLVSPFPLRAPKTRAMMQSRDVSRESTGSAVCPGFSKDPESLQGSYFAL